MSYYRQNHLQDDWQSMESAKRADRVAKAEEEARFYFDLVTTPQKAVYDATMRDLLGMTGPRWDRAREAAKAAWKASTKDASDLFDRTVECILEMGEVSSDLDSAWTQIIERSALVEA